jgi:hypothetical protein
MGRRHHSTVPATGIGSRARVRWAGCLDPRGGTRDGEGQSVIDWHFYRTLEPELAAVWDEAAARYDAHPYQAAAVARVRAAHLGHGLGFLLGYADGDLVFGSAVFIRRRGLLPPHWVCSYGPWARDAATFARGIQDLVRHWPKTWQKPISLIIDPRFLPSADETVTTLRALDFHEQVPAEVNPESMCIDLTIPQTEIWRSFPKRTRQTVNKAAALKLQSRIGTAADLQRFKGFFDQVVTASKQDAGYHVPPLDLLEALHGTGRAWVVLTESPERLVGCFFVIRSQGTLHAVFAARAPDFAGPGLWQTYWFTMCWAQQQGLQLLNLGAVVTGNDGLAWHKKRWGGRMVLATPQMEHVFRPWLQRWYLLGRRWRVARGFAWFQQARRCVFG